MTARWFPGLRRVCEAVPTTNLDEQLESFSVLQRLVVFVASGLTAFMLASLLTDGGATPAVAVVLAFGTLQAFTDVIAWYNRQ